MSTDNNKLSSVPLEENLKKALTELLVLHLLSQRDYFVGELAETLSQQSAGILKLAFPYSAIYRLRKDGHIIDTGKRIAPDGRKRQFYRISQSGYRQYQTLISTYRNFITGVNTILEIEHP